MYEVLCYHCQCTYCQLCRYYHLSTAFERLLTFAPFSSNQLDIRLLCLLMILSLHLFQPNCDIFNRIYLDDIESTRLYRFLWRNTIAWLVSVPFRLICMMVFRNQWWCAGRKRELSVGVGWVHDWLMLVHWNPWWLCRCRIVLVWNNCSLFTKMASCWINHARG